jgi:aminodeoxyfutalosine synthase
MTTQKLIENIQEKLKRSQRITAEEALILYREVPLGILGKLALYRKQELWGNEVFYNKNIHVETSNICINKCRFCSFYRDTYCNDAWEYSVDEVISKIDSKYNLGITEVHIVGSLHPENGLEYFCNLFKQIKTRWPSIHVKAFTAVEIEHVALLSDISIKECIIQLRNAGMDSVAGGGAEIFDEGIRKKLCPEKTTSNDWLNIHKKLHQHNIQSNCTMLYGHIETYEHRVEHMNRLRELQNETHGFNCFIPLKYKHAHNELGLEKEIPLSEDLRNYAVARIFLDNIPHIKAYWPMIGKEAATLALHFGADDMDGTINDSTKIYSMAGAKDKKPTINENEMQKLIINEGMIPVERDSLFNKIKSVTKS